MGQQFREELTRLQSEMIIMGEIQIKCKDKLSELTNLKARDAETDNIHATYVEEVRGKRVNLVLFVFYTYQSFF